VIELEVADLVVIAGRALGLDTSQVLDLLDPAAAEQALTQARPVSEPSEQAAPGVPAILKIVDTSGTPGAPVTLKVLDVPGSPGAPAVVAAALLHALVRQRPFQRGNQQVALAAMLQFLAVNGWDMDPDPPEPVAAMVAEVAAGELDIMNVAACLTPRLRPIGYAAAQVKEAPVRHEAAFAERLKMATMRRQPKGMFQRFTDRARQAIYLAQEEARLLRHDHVGPEHLLLGLLYEGEGVAATALESLGISLEGIREQIEEIIGRGQSPAEGHIPFASEAKKALEVSLREALQLGHSYIGTEHVLLALLCADEGVPCRVLAAAGADHGRVRDQVLRLLASGGGLADPHTRMVRVSVPTDLVAATERLAGVRRQKQAAFDAGNLDQAAELRDREKQLRADKRRLEDQLTSGVDVQAVVAENQRVHRELDRLRDLLRQHGIEPDGGTAQSA
jgi:Clp amino terminal domain, pathogenicity island component